MKLEIVFKDGRKEILDSVASFQVTEEQTANTESNALKVVKTPTEGMLFEVNPLEIDRSIFNEPMRDTSQDWTRRTILEAFEAVDRYPERYSASFYTLIPEKKWDGYKTVEELKMYASDCGGMMATWVEQALEWAQRICNGESWESICNNPDTANWYRMIIWNHIPNYRIVGGSRHVYDRLTASAIHRGCYYSTSSVFQTVPLIAIKKK